MENNYGNGLLQQYISKNPNQRILDIGCGPGNLTKELQPLGSFVLGIDSSEQLINQAQTSYPDVKFQVMDALEINYDKEWDIIFSNAVFHWIENQDLLLDNIYKALKPNGRLICEFGECRNVETLTTAFESCLKEMGYAYHCRFQRYTVEAYGELLRKHGFEVEKSFDYARPLPLPDGEAGLRNWIKRFFAIELKEIPISKHEEICSKMEEMTREKLWDGEQWIADHHRLRVIAHIENR